MAWTVDELTRWLDEIEPRMDQLDLFAWLELTPDALPSQIQPAFHAVARTRHPDLFRTRLPAAGLDRLVRVYARITAAYAELRDPARCEQYARALSPGPPPVQVARTRTQHGPPVARTDAPVQVARTRTPPPPGTRPSTTPPPQVPRTTTSSLQVPRTTTSAPQVTRTTTPPPQVARTTTSPPQVARTTSSPPQVARTTSSPPQVARTTTSPQVPRTTTSPQVARTPTGQPPDSDAPIDPAREMNARALAFYRRAEGALRVGDHSTALLQLRMAVASDPSSMLLRAALRELTDLITER